MGIAFRIMIFVLLFNIASGIINVALSPYYTNGLPSGIEYDPTMDSMDSFSGQVQAPGAEGSSGWWDKFTDFLKIGFFKKIIEILDLSVYGILGIMKNLGFMPQEYYGYFYGILTIIYAVGIIDLYTGKKIQY